MKITIILYLIVFYVSSCFGETVSLNIDNHGAPIVSGDGSGVRCSWAVGRFKRPIDDSTRFLRPDGIRDNFVQNGSDGGGFTRGLPGFFEGAIIDASVSRQGEDVEFLDQTIVILIGDNPLGLTQSNGYILIDTGLTWKIPSENPGLEYNISINNTSNIAFGSLRPYTGGGEFPSDLQGIEFDFNITSAGVSLASVAVLPVSSTTGAVKINIRSPFVISSLATAGWRLPSDTSLRPSGQQVNGLREGILAISFSNANGYDPPPTWGIEVVAGELREYDASYNPNQSELNDIESPLITSITRTDQSIALSWRSQITITYAIDYSRSLRNDDWLKIAGGLEASSQETFYEDTDAQRIALDIGFYRVRVE